jgi:hypothetical protein
MTDVGDDDRVSRMQVVKAGPLSADFELGVIHNVSFSLWRDAARLPMAGMRSRPEAASERIATSEIDSDMG